MSRLLIFAFAVASLGCSGSTEQAGSAKQPAADPKANGGKAAQNASQGPHGGRVFILNPGNVRGEFVYDEASKAVQVFLDALPAEDAQKVVFDAKVSAGQVEEFPLKKEGDKWASKDEKLIAKLREGRSAKVTLTVNAKKGTLMTFEYLGLN